MNMSDHVPVLLVDDLPANLTALEALLTDENITVLKARSGTEALELLLAHDFAVALLDVQMPEMNGFQLAELMRGMQRTRHVPIIFVTAGAADTHRRFQGYEAGAVDFISKPIEPHVLRSKVRVLCDLHRQRQQIAAQRDELAASAAALREADRAKDRFLAILAHELRNPVAALMGAVELLGRPRSADQAGIIHARMERTVSHLARLVEDLLDVSRITEGKMILKIQRIALADALSFAVESSQHHMEAGNHHLTVVLPEEPVWFDGDYSRVAQIVANLLGNAAKYTPPGGAIKLSARTIGGEIVIEVADNGMGIPADMKARIFEAFAQVEDHRAYAQGGLGIGLALVHRLVTLHGGSVSVESEGQGQGSVFTVRLVQVEGGE